MFNYARMLQKRRGVKMDKDLSIKLYKQSYVEMKQVFIITLICFYKVKILEKNIEKSSKVFKNRFSFNG